MGRWLDIADVSCAASQNLVAGASCAGTAATMILKKVGHRGNIAIPDHRELDEGMARSLVKQMGLTVDGFLEIARK